MSVLKELYRNTLLCIGALSAQRNRTKRHIICNIFSPVNDVQTSLNQIEESLAHCVPLVQRLNNLLPEEDRLERFKLHPEPLEGDESDGGSSDGERGEGGEAVMDEEAEGRGGGGETERSVELNESERDSRTHDIEYETGPT